MSTDNNMPTKMKDYVNIWLSYCPIWQYQLCSLKLKYTNVCLFVTFWNELMVSPQTQALVFSKQTIFKWKVQVNLCQKLLFLHQLTHNMMTDCSLFMKIVSSEYLQNMLCTQIVVFVLFRLSEQFWYTTCSPDVASFWKRFTCNNMWRMLVTLFSNSENLVKFFLMAYPLWQIFPRPHASFDRFLQSIALMR